MARYTVTVVDTTQIQDYVFGSNRLQENIGASELVRLATGEWALKAVMDVAAENNVADPVGKKNFKIEEITDAKAAEVIYSGGGNMVVIFSDEDMAQRFAGKLTRKVLQCAPELSLVIAHDNNFIWDRPESNERALSEIVTKLLRGSMARAQSFKIAVAAAVGTWCDGSL